MPRKASSATPTLVPKNFLEQIQFVDTGTLRKLALYISGAWRILVADQPLFASGEDDQPALTNNFNLTIIATHTVLGTMGANSDCGSIVAGTAGQFAILQGRYTLGTNTLTFKTTTSNVVLNPVAGNFVMGVNDTLALVYDGVGAKWVEVTRSKNH